MRVEFHGIQKKYLLKTALNDISVCFDSGKIHALLGENGAGKSTLAGILAGDIAPTAGYLLLDRERCVFRTTHDARVRGIVLVHQRPLLADSLTVQENIFLGTLNSFADKAADKARHEELHALQKKWAPHLLLNALTADLSADDRFYTAFLSALLIHPTCLILDEPSAFLDITQRKALYTGLKQLASNGCTIIIITHSPAEACTYADDITFLHEGLLEAHYTTAKEFSSFCKKNGAEQDLTTQEKRVILQDKTEHSTKNSCFSLQHASSHPRNKPALIDATITVNYGTITMITGSKESALGTLEDVITGMSVSSCKGTFTLQTKQNAAPVTLSLNKLSARFLRRNNAAIVPSDRTFRASNPQLTVEQMLTVFYNGNDTRSYAEKLIAKSAVHISSQQKSADLSGGMLQRLILEREQSLNPDLFILCEPMQGLDMQAQSSLCKRLVSFASQDKAVLVLGAADFPLSLCNRVYTLEGGVTSLSFESPLLQKEHTV